MSVFHSLADCKVSALDISDYEGAEVIHDMNLPLPDEYKGRFDFIFDGSSMDNIFNGPQALISMSELLRPGGRMVLYNASNSVHTGYLQFSPDWFIDFFAVNRYADCKVYIQEFPWVFEEIVSKSLPEGGYPPQGGCLWHFDPLVSYSDQWGYQNSEIKDEGHRYVYVMAEKAADSTSTIAPVQMHYRGQNRATYVESALRFRASARPLYRPRTGEPFTAPSISAWEVVYPISRWSRRTYPVQTPSPHVNQAPVRLPPPHSGAKPVNAVIEDPKASISTLTADREKLRTELDAARQTIESMRNSFFWKMTQPLRKLVG